MADCTAYAEVAQGFGRAGGYAELVMSLSPVGYWRLNEKTGTTAVDEMGANNGTYVDSPTLGAAGLLAGDANTAMTLNGTTQYMSVPWTTSLNLGDSFSLVAWFVHYSGASYRSFLSCGTNAPLLQITNANKLALVKTGVIQLCDSGSALVAGPHFAVGTKNGADIHLFLDGNEVTANVTNGTCVNNANARTFGSSLGGELYSGVLDEPAIWNRALSPAEIAALYQAGVTGGLATAKIIANAAVAEGAGAAADASASVSPNAEVAAAIGAAPSPAASITSYASAAEATGAASDAKPSLSSYAAVAEATGTAADATVSIAPSAIAATATGIAHDASTAIAVWAELATASGEAYGAAARIAPWAGCAIGTGTAYGAAAWVQAMAGCAIGTGTAYGATEWDIGPAHFMSATIPRRFAGR